MIHEFFQIFFPESSRIKVIIFQFLTYNNFIYISKSLLEDATHSFSFVKWIKFFKDEKKHTPGCIDPKILLLTIKINIICSNCVKQGTYIYTYMLLHFFYCYYKFYSPSSGGGWLLHVQDAANEMYNFENVIKQKCIPIRSNYFATILKYKKIDLENYVDSILM